MNVLIYIVYIGYMGMYKDIQRYIELYRQGALSPDSSNSYKELPLAASQASLAPRKLFASGRAAPQTRRSSGRDGRTGKNHKGDLVLVVFDFDWGLGGNPLFAQKQITSNALQIMSGNLLGARCLCRDRSGL